MTAARSWCLVLASTLLCCAAVTAATAQERTWMVIARGAVTTSSQLFPDPNSTDPVARSQSFEIGAAYGYGAEIRYSFPEAHAAVGLSVEYLRASFDHPIVTIRGNAIPVNDGYVVVPIELTGYFIIPFSGEVFGIYMGGGGGFYPGQRRYSVGGVLSAQGTMKPGAGIHVLAGASYRPFSHLSLLAEMKFRDVQFEAVNSFGVTRIPYGGMVVTVPPQADASVHTDGIIFQVGIGFSF